MKKSIAVIAYDPLAGRAYAQQVKKVFGTRVVVRNYSTLDDSVQKAERCDLYMTSTDALDAMEDPSRYIPTEAQRMEIHVTYLKEVIRRLQEIPKDTKVLYVNITEMMAREAVTKLEQLGVTHLKFILYAPGSILTEAVDIAVTPDEERYVPNGISQVINLGQRTCSTETMIEAVLRLGYDELLEEAEFKRYQESVCSNTYYFDQMFNYSRRLESQFDILMDVLDQGMIAVNEHGEINAINKVALAITCITEPLGMCRSGEKVFPYIPFRKCLDEKCDMEPQVVRVDGKLITLTVRPVLRRGVCVGAFAILQKFDEIEQRQNELRGQLLKRGQGLRAKYCFDDVAGKSESIIRTKAILQKMAWTETPVLLIGETGTGKELFAHSVHNASKRRKQPFIAINCGAMPDNLLESELFGYEDGAFTGAKKGGRPGLFEFAHKGTLFLDEVEGMSPALQVKLLRVLQEHEIMRVGGSQIIHVDVRIVAATNEELEQKVENGTFRRDLYYRLNALPALIPPLRDRGDDVFVILELVRLEIGGTFTLSENIKDLFQKYQWPGNIRELRNVVEYLSFTGRSLITEEELPPVFRMEKRKSCHVADEKTGQAFISELPTETERLVLEILYEAERNGQSLGRDKILLEAGKRSYKLTQTQVRKILCSLGQGGYIVVMRGRGGSSITKKGRNWITN